MLELSSIPFQHISHPLRELEFDYRVFHYTIIRLVDVISVRMNKGEGFQLMNDFALNISCIKRWNERINSKRERRALNSR